jgi:peptidyl-prolyl cis-trans isomerase C
MDIRRRESCQEVVVYILLSLLVIFSGYGFSFKKASDKVLARVNGSPITEDDLIYAIEIEHRREDLSGAKKLDIRGFLKRMIDEKLIIEEARSMGFEDTLLVKKKVHDFIVRESVVRLYKDEIASKIKVTDEEVREFFKKNYEKYNLRIIEVGTKEKAEEIMGMLKKGEDFGELAKRYSTHYSAKDGGKVTYTRLVLSQFPIFESVVAKLKPFEISEPVEINGKFYIIQMLGKEAPSEEELKEKKSAIRERIRKIKEEKKSQEYLEHLRQKADIEINRELISLIYKTAKEKGVDELKNDQRPVVKVNGDILTVGDFLIMTKDATVEHYMRLVKRWIDNKLVDQEALSRHYDEKEPLKQMIQRYKDQILKRVFIANIVIPQIRVDEERLRQYYEEHKEKYRTPTLYRIQQITVKSLKEAEEILSEIKKGADFSWLAKRFSRDRFASSSGMVGWKRKSQMPAQLSKLIDQMKVGDVTEPIKTGEVYRLVRLEDKKEGRIKRFEEVKEEVRKDYIDQEIKRILDEYLRQLRKDAEIEVFEEAIERFEKRFSK